MNGAVYRLSSPSEQAARSPSMAMSLCRQTLQTKQEHSDASRSLCSQEIALILVHVARLL